MRAGVRHQMVVALAAVVVHVRGQEMARDGLDGFAEIAHQVRVAVVEADADVEPVELILDEMHQRLRRSTAHSESLRARRARSRGSLSRQISSTLRRASSGWLSFAATRSVVGVPRCTTRWRYGTCLASAMAASVSCSAVLRLASSREAFENGSIHLPPLSASTIGACTEWSSRPRVGEPFSQFRGRPLVVIVEVRASREELDGLEAVRGDVDQVLAAQPVLVKQMCRDAEAVHRACLSEVPPDVRRAVPATGQIANRAPCCRARSSRSAGCIGCKRDCRGKSSGSRTCRAPSDCAAGP